MFKRLLLSLVLLSSACFGATRTATVTGDWANTATWGGALAPTNGDICIINTAVVVTVTTAVTVGTDGATGTVACTVNGPTGQLITDTGGNLILHGDVATQNGTSFKVLNGGILTYDPLPGVTYRVTRVNVSTGVPVLQIDGTPGTRATVTTTTRGGGNGWFRTAGLAAWNYTIDNADFNKIGDATNPSLQFTLGTSGATYSVTNSSFVSSGNAQFAVADGTSNITLDGLDFRNSLSTVVAQMTGITDVTSGTRIVKNITNYSASTKQFVFQAHDIKCGASIAGGDGQDTPCLVGYFWKFVNSGCLRCKFSTGAFIIPSAAPTATHMIQVDTADSQIYEDWVVYSHTVNQNPITETATSGGLASNIYRRMVCDNDGQNVSADFTGGAAGSLTIANNILIRGCGTLVTVNFTGRSVLILNNTSYGVEGAAMSETGTGNTAVFDGFRNNLFVKPLRTGAADGVHQGQGGVFLRQTNITSALWNYNGFWDMPGSGDAGAEAAIAAPDYLPLGAVLSYVKFPDQPVPNLTSKLASATVDATHWTCSTCDFVTNGVAVDDYVYRTSDKLFALVASITDATHLVLVSPGITSLVSGNTLSVVMAYNAGKIYGTDFGQHDIHADPGFKDVTRSFATWDTSLSGTGTLANVALEMVKLNGHDSTGASAAFDGVHTAPAALAWVRFGFTPTNSTLQGAGDPADGSPDIGAVQVSAPSGSGTGPGGIKIE